MLKLLKTTLRMELARRGYHVRGPRSFGTDPLIDLNKFISSDAIRTVFDVGANEGQSLQKFKQSYPHSQVHCFEPGTAPFGSLQKVASRYSNVVLSNLALSDAKGQTILHTHTHHQANSILSASQDIQQFLHGELIDSSGQETVDLTTIDQYCADKQLTQIDLLKIDTQGLELKVLQGAQGLFSQKKVRAVIVEFQMAPHYVGQSWYHEVCRFLTENKLGLVWLYESVWDDRSFLSWSNGLFVLRD